MRFAVACIILVTACVGVLGQQEAADRSPSFAVLSMRPADPNQRLGIKRSGGRITIASDRFDMVGYAFDVGRFEIDGLKPDDNSLVLEGESSDPGASDQQLREMVQNALIERLHLRYHFSDRTGRVYKLIVAPGGPKLVRSQDGATPSAQPKDVPGQVPEGTSIFVPIAGGLEMYGHAIDIGRLCRFLSDNLQTEVEDETGIRGKFDVQIRFSPAPLTANADAATLPPIFAALQQQLGLGLDPSTGQIRTLVIDHIDSLPTPNP